jgi:hypothetical protein
VSAIAEVFGQEFADRVTAEFQAGRLKKHLDPVTYATYYIFEGKVLSLEAILESL